jgi:DNA-binding NtrC family response regulator
VDDAPDMLELIQRNLASQGFAVSTAASARDALALLAAATVDLLVTDVRMPGLSGMDLVREVRERHPGIEIIVITGYATIEGAVEALQLGAWDYLAKPFTDEELFQAVRRVLARRPAGTPEPAAPVEFHGLLGRSQVMRATFEALAAAAKRAGPLLLEGEPGSGRESAARAVHALAGRPGLFLRVSVDARSAGAAAGDAPGMALAVAARACAGGTLYLAELDGAGDETRRAVLDLLTGGRRGGDGAAVRIVGSIVADPAGRARGGRRLTELAGRFPLAVAIPPLRERGEDVVLLARRFLAEAASAAGLAARTLSPAAEQALRAYAWPGNVRELRVLATRLALAGRSGPVVAGELPATMAQPPGSESGADLTLAAAEREHILRVLRQTGGNKSRAAELLGIDRKTLRDKLREGPAAP